jgi:hypothetical protein
MKHNLRLQNIGRTQAKDTFYLISTADSPVLSSRPHDRATLGECTHKTTTIKGAYTIFLDKEERRERRKRTNLGGGGGERGDVALYTKNHERC